MKLILNATIAGVAHEGSTVFDSVFRSVSNPAMSGGSPFGGLPVGDAVMVDLQSAGVLFGVWGRVTDADYHGFMGDAGEVLSILPKERVDRWDGKDTGIFDELRQIRDPRPLRKKSWPVLVHLPIFTDLKTARLVGLDDVETVLGAGSSISVSLAATDAPISRGIEKRLPWWGQLNDPSPKSRKLADWPIYQRLSSYHFVR